MSDWATIAVDLITEWQVGESSLTLPNNVTIQFYSLWPIYKEEMELKQEKGMEVLANRFRMSGTSELIQLDRKNVGKG